MTNDTIWNTWQKGIQEVLTNSLSNAEELKIQPTESINSLIQNLGISNYALLTHEVAQKISYKMKTNVFIFGNIINAGSKVRIYAQLIDSKKEEVLKPFQIEGRNSEEDIIPLIDTLSLKIKNTLIILNLGKAVSYDYKNYVSTNSPAAYKDFIDGKNAFLNGDLTTAAKMLSLAIEIDSNFIGAKDMLAWAYHNQGRYDQAKKMALELYKNKDQVSMYMKAVLDHTYAAMWKTASDDIKCLQKILEIDNQVPLFHWNLGLKYAELSEFDMAISEYEKSLEIYNKWGLKIGRAHV
jgi:tetratricopeptide (TPR) repeat protein